MLCNQRIHLNVKIGTKLYCSSLCYAKNVYKEKKTDPTESLWKKKPNKRSIQQKTKQTIRTCTVATNGEENENNDEGLALTAMILRRLYSINTCELLRLMLSVFFCFCVVCLLVNFFLTSVDFFFHSFGWCAVASFSLLVFFLVHKFNDDASFCFQLNVIQRSSK